MLTSRDQWYNEGQPVMRHLRNFENNCKNKICYCLFIAPSLHVDTINTFWSSVKHEYEGIRQRIVPITINDLIYLIDKVKIVQEKNKKFTHLMLEEFYREATEVSDVTNSIAWIAKIKKILSTWLERLIT
jgi:hypothetical protein